MPTPADAERDEFERIVEQTATTALSYELFGMMQRGCLLIGEMPHGPERTRDANRFHGVILECVAPQLIAAAQSIKEPALRLDIYKRVSLFLWQVLEMPVVGAEANARCDQWRTVLEGLRLTTGAAEA